MWINFGLVFIKCFFFLIERVLFMIGIGLYLVILMKEKEEIMGDLVVNWLYIEVFKWECINKVGIFR